MLQDAYSLEFLSIPAAHSEADLHSALLRNLGRFLAELGRDFCFVGSVEHALSRSLSPALIAEYQTQLPDKKLLAAKLYEFYAMNEPLETGRPKRKDSEHDRRPQALSRDEGLRRAVAGGRTGALGGQAGQDSLAPIATPCDRTKDPGAHP